MCCFGQYAYGIRSGQRGAHCGIDLQTMYTTPESARAMNQSGVTATIITTITGVIEWVDPLAARLLNVSARACLGRDLYQFFAADRLTLRASARQATLGDTIESEARIRPRDKRPVAVALRLAMDSNAEGSLRWIFTVQEPLPTWLVG
jgi:PAS domain-containing protein